MGQRGEQRGIITEAEKPARRTLQEFRGDLIDARLGVEKCVQGYVKY